MLPFVWSDDCLLHEPEAEVWIGTRTPATEVPARALAIRAALATAGAQEVAAVSHDDSALLAVHDPAIALLDRAGGPVAIVDIDAHHGNGTQELFLGRADILTASVHVDPGAGWFPHFLGFEAENDEANLNLPLAPSTGDDGWLAAVRE